ARGLRADHDGGVSGHSCPPAPVPVGGPRASRVAVRLLYSRLSDDDPRLLARASQPDRRGNPGGPGGSPLSMYWLSGHCGGRRRRGAAHECGNAEARKRGSAMSSSAFPRFRVSPFPSLRALSVSRPVHTALGQPRVGQVLAAFTRSCYVDLEGRIVALV